MTREEAIEVLKANYPSKCFEQLREAVDMAIKALEAQDWKVDVEQATANFAKKLEEGHFKPQRKCLADYFSDDPSLLRKIGAEELGIESPNKWSEQIGKKIADFVEILTDSSTDCISREAAISAAKHIFKSNSEMKAFCMMKMLEELPPVKPKNYFEEVAKDIDIMEEDIDLARDALVEDDDCISREAVIEILSNYGCTNKEGLLFRDIKELPAVRPKERTWEWKWKQGEIDWYKFGECFEDCRRAAESLQRIR